jgi:hypothetical protein
MRCAAVGRLSQACFRDTGSKPAPILTATLLGQSSCVSAHSEAPRFLCTQSLSVGGHYPDRVTPKGQLVGLVAQLVCGLIVGEVGCGYRVAVHEKLDVGRGEIIFGVPDGRAYEGTTILDS